MRPDDPDARHELVGAKQAVLYPQMDVSENLLIEVSDDDARVIAAAPKLLRAAEQALSTMEWAEANVPGTNLQSDIILLRAAIAEAYGDG